MSQVLSDMKRLTPLFIISFVAFIIFFGFVMMLTFATVGMSGYGANVNGVLDGFNLIVNVISLVLTARLSSWLFLIVEDELGFLEALKVTWQMSKGRALRIIGYILLFSVIMVLCVLAMMLGVGILWIPAIVTEFNLVVVSIVGFLTVVGLLFMSAVLSLVENNFYCAIYHALKRENTPEPEETTSVPDELIF